MLKYRNSLLVSLTLAVALLAMTWREPLAASKPSGSAPAAATSIQAKPGALPTTGEPEGSGNSTPMPKPEVQRMGQRLAPELDPEVFLQLLIQWYLQVWMAQQPTRY